MSILQGNLSRLSSFVQSTTGAPQGFADEWSAITGIFTGGHPAALGLRPGDRLTSPDRKGLFYALVAAR